MAALDECSTQIELYTMEYGTSKEWIVTVVAILYQVSLLQRSRVKEIKHLIIAVRVPI